MVRPLRREDLVEMVVAPGVRDTAPPIVHREWPFSKAVFVAGVRSKVMHSRCGFFVTLPGFGHGGLLEISLRVRYRDGYRRETEREFQGPPKELPMTPRR
jgi:hypothetical protein